MAADKDCIACESRGELGLIKLYEKNFMMAARAKVVIGDGVAGFSMTMTWRKGWSKDGASNVCISNSRRIIRSVVLSSEMIYIAYLCIQSILV